MKNNFELIEFGSLSHVNIFLNRIQYRTPHFHPAFEVGVVLEGETDFIISGELHKLHQYDVVLLNPNQLHEIKSREDGALLLFVQLSNYLFREVYPAAQSLYFEESAKIAPSDPAVTEMIRNLAVELTFQYFRADENRLLLASSLLFILFSKILQSFDHRYLSTAEQQSAQTQVARINKLVNFVDANYTQKINLSDFAAQEDLSLSYLSRFVKENFGQSFQDYVTLRRFYHARNLMQYENKTMIDICYESGFSDPRYLTKVFVQRLGVTPEEYRSQRVAFTHTDEGLDFKSYPNTIESKFADEQALALLQRFRPSGTYLGNIVASVLGNH